MKSSLTLWSAWDSVPALSSYMRWGKFLSRKPVTKKQACLSNSWKQRNQSLLVMHPMPNSPRMITTMQRWVSATDIRHSRKRRQFWIGSKCRSFTSLESATWESDCSQIYLVHSCPSIWLGYCTLVLNMRMTHRFLSQWLWCPWLFI